MFPYALRSIVLVLCASSAQALTLDEALIAAKNYAPDLIASQSGEVATHALTQSAGSLPDPKIAFTIDSLPLEGEDQYQVGKSMRSIGLMQEFPNAGKRAAERQIATAAWQASSAQHRYAQLNVKRATTLAWLSLYYTQEKAQILDAQVIENQNSLSLSRAALAGGGTADNALAAQLETQQLADARDDLKSELQQARALLARWIGPDRAREIVNGPLPVWQREPASEDQFSKQPDLHAASSQISAARAELALMEAGKHPDWGLELALQRSDMGQSQAMVRIYFDLPFFTASRQDPKIAAATANLQRAEAEKTARSAGYRQQYAELNAQGDALTSQLQRLKQLTLPLIQKQAELALAGLQSSKGSSNAVLEARKTKRVAQLRALDLTSRLATIQAQIFFLTGGH
ncbi:TolC family protein [Iodobacter arcticus]|uniref:TolC family protein n=1 Tax=Iodobacter arcticus TaxID=590593 RepID=A0ABW2R352_9NEIS